MVRPPASMMRLKSESAAAAGKPCGEARNFSRGTALDTGGCGERTQKPGSLGNALYALLRTV